MTDGLDLFAPNPDRSHSSLIDVPAPAEDIAARSSMDEAPPELVWLDATDGLEDFAPLPDRHHASSLTDVPVPQAAVIAAATEQDVEKGHASRFDWMKRAGRAALLGSVLAAAADGFLAIRPPATPLPAVARPEPAIDAPETGDPVEFGGRSALARLDAAPQAAVKDPPPVPPVVVRTAASASPRTDDRGGPRGAPPARAPRSDVRSGPRVATPAVSLAGSTPGPARPARVVPANDAPARGATPAGNTTAVAGPRALPATSVAARTLAPISANAAAASPPAEAMSPAAGPSVDTPARTETARAASTDGSLAAVAAPPRRELEARAIENVLGRYRNAFNRLDAGAASAVWPSVNEKTLARAFERLADQDVSFESCEIEIVAVLAEAACSGSARYVPKVGSRTPRAEARQWRFSLRKASDGWLIDRVDAR